MILSMVPIRSDRRQFAQPHGDEHFAVSIVTVLAPPIATAHDVGLPEVAALLLVAALVVMVMVPLLLALHAHVRHDHLGAVAHRHAVPAVVSAARRRQVFPRPTANDKEP